MRSLIKTYTFRLTLSVKQLLLHLHKHYDDEWIEESILYASGLKDGVCLGGQAMLYLPFRSNYELKFASRKNGVTFNKIEWTHIKYSMGAEYSKIKIGILASYF